MAHAEEFDAALDDPDSFRAVIEVFERPLFVFVARFLGDPADREELVQDVFLAAFQHRHRFDRERGSLRTWLFSIARNRCRNHRQRRQPQLLDDLRSELSEDCPSKTADAVMEDLLHRELRRRLDDALKRLPDSLRSTFVLAEILDFPHREVAVVEGIEEGTVKSRVHRARARLRAILEDLRPQFRAPNHEEAPR